MSPREDESSTGSRRAVQAIVAPVAACGLGVAAYALYATAAARPGAGLLLGVLALLAAATAAEAFPVSVGGVTAGGISLAASFIVGAALIYDWRVATLIGLLSRGIIEISERRPLDRLAYNSAVYALSAAAAGSLIATFGAERDASDLVLAIGVGAFGFYAVNVGLVSLVISASTGAPFRHVIAGAGRATAVSFGIMGSLSLILEVLWQRSPPLSLALVGPLLAVALYQRSMLAAFEAMRLAHSDPLTGLGNSRAFGERLTELSSDTSTRFSLCVVDIDGFKQVNDRHGHQVGDAVLVRVASCLPAFGEGFRVGGDELALVLTDAPPEPVAESLLQAIAGADDTLAGPVTVSIGMAVFPDDGSDPERLVACADRALYHAKRSGRNRVARYALRLAEPLPDLAAHRAEQSTTLWKLTEIIDAADDQDPSDADRGHSRRVAELAAALAKRLGCAPEKVEQIRLAAQLHDLGKLTVPVEILNKKGSLGEVEWHRLREHPETGRRILDALGAGSVADWVLHHHERWDGTGYPSGLAGEKIPLASRIIFVADAFDAMTSNRPYRDGLSVEYACHELSACAGAQFDPDVVAALLDEIAGREARRMAG